MTFKDMQKTIFASTSVENRMFFNLVIPPFTLENNYTTINFHKLLFLQGEGLKTNVKKYEKMHINNFHIFFIEIKPEHYKKIITIIFGGIWQ